MLIYATLAAFILTTAFNVALATTIVDLIATEDSKTFRTPGYPTTLYPNNASCEWRIQAPENRFVLITFLEGNTESCCDHIRVVDGAEINGQFSGPIIPGTSRISSGNTLKIFFSSDDSIRFSGFLARYQTATCGRNIPIATPTPTELTSVGWPNSYFNNQKCFWILYGVGRKQIELTLIRGRIAQSDYIEVFDGLSRMGRQSGDIRGSVFTSKNGILTLTFTSDGENRGQGFLAHYKQASCGTTSQVTKIPVEISTPSYPNFYPTDLQCEWNLFAAQTQRIKVIFIEGDTEDCCDIIEFIDGNATLGTFSGNIIPGSSITSNSNKLQIRFVSDSSGIAPGFRALFQEVDASSTCGGILTVSDTPMNISSPLYPFIYENDLSCSWTLQAESHRTIMLTFLEGSTQDCCDIIRVTDQRVEILTLSGLIQEQVTLMSKSNSLTITFNSDSSNVSSGFFATFHQVAVATTMSTTPESTTTPTTTSTTLESTTTATTIRIATESTTIPTTTSTVHESTTTATTIRIATESTTIPTTTSTVHESTTTATTIPITTESTTIQSICQRPFQIAVEDTSTSISTHSYPDQFYSNDLSCAWILGASNNRQIMLKFLGGETEKDVDLIKVFDEANGSRLPVPILTLSGKITPGRSVISRRNRMLITFTSDSSIVNRGFSASVEEATCGSNKRASTAAKNFGYSLDRNYENCYWIVYTRSKRQVELKFTSGYVHQSGSVQVSDGKVSYDELRGNLKDRRFVSTKGFLQIHFQNDKSWFARLFNFLYSHESSFQATYKEICGQNFTASETKSYVNSPNWPNKYPEDFDCEWFIIVPVSAQVRLIVEYLDIEPAYDFLKIYDGTTRIATLYGRSGVRLEYISTSRYFRLVFHSDEYRPKRGFRASFVQFG